jgi:hypothetical protein
MKVVLPGGILKSTFGLPRFERNPAEATKVTLIWRCHLGAGRAWRSLLEKS